MGSKSHFARIASRAKRVFAQWFGRVAEWFKAAVLKTARGFALPRGFESHPFRHVVSVFSGLDSSAQPTPTAITGAKVGGHRARYHRKKLYGAFECLDPTGPRASTPLRPGLPGLDLMRCCGVPAGRRSGSDSSSPAYRSWHRSLRSDRNGFTRSSTTVIA